MPNKRMNHKSEIHAVLALLVLLGVSFVVSKVLAFPFVFVFIGLGSLGWGVLHICEIKLRKQIEEKNKVVFDISPETVVLNREQFDPPISAVFIDKDNQRCLVDVVQRITTRDHIFIGFRKKENNEEGVCLEGDIEFIE